MRRRSNSRTPEHVRENLDAARIQLHPDTLRRLDDALAGFEVAVASLL